MPDTQRPNLIYVFADQLRAQSCGYAGDARAQTPNLDAFAAQGVNFTNAVSGHPVCAPYRASLLTGKYTTGTGMVINELRINPNQRCLAHVLTDAGYETAYIGKWHLWANALGHHDDPKNSYTPPGPYRLGFGWRRIPSSSSPPITGSCSARTGATPRTSSTTRPSGCPS
jgi:arylsulfatase A-like enzyme